LTSLRLVISAVDFVFWSVSAPAIFVEKGFALLFLLIQLVVRAGVWVERSFPVPVANTLWRKREQTRRSGLAAG